MLEKNESKNCWNQSCSWTKKPDPFTMPESSDRQFLPVSPLLMILLRSQMIRSQPVAKGRRSCWLILLLFTWWNVSCSGRGPNHQRSKTPARISGSTLFWEGRAQDRWKTKWYRRDTCFAANNRSWKARKGEARRVRNRWWPNCRLFSCRLLQTEKQLGGLP